MASRDPLIQQPVRVQEVATKVGVCLWWFCIGSLAIASFLGAPVSAIFQRIPTFTAALCYTLVSALIGALAAVFASSRPPEARQDPEPRVTAEGPYSSAGNTGTCEAEGQHAAPLCVPVCSDRCGACFDVLCNALSDAFGVFAAVFNFVKMMDKNQVWQGLLLATSVVLAAKLGFVQNFVFRCHIGCLRQGFATKEYYQLKMATMPQKAWGAVFGVLALIDDAVALPEQFNASSVGAIVMLLVSVGLAVVDTLPTGVMAARLLHLHAPFDDFYLMHRERKGVSAIHTFVPGLACVAMALCIGIGNKVGLTPLHLFATMAAVMLPLTIASLTAGHDRRQNKDYMVGFILWPLLLWNPDPDPTLQRTARIGTILIFDLFILARLPASPNAPLAIAAVVLMVAMAALEVKSCVSALDGQAWNAWLTPVPADDYKEAAKQLFPPEAMPILRRKKKFIVRRVPGYYVVGGLDLTPEQLQDRLRRDSQLRRERPDEEVDEDHLQDVNGCWFANGYVHLDFEGPPIQVWSEVKILARS